jgi:hypothetical protein
MPASESEQATTTTKLAVGNRRKKEKILKDEKKNSFVSRGEDGVETAGGRVCVFVAAERSRAREF